MYRNLKSIHTLIKVDGKSGTSASFAFKQLNPRSLMFLSLRMLTGWHPEGVTDVGLAAVEKITNKPEEKVISIFPKSCSDYFTTFLGMKFMNVSLSLSLSLPYFGFWILTMNGKGTLHGEN